jgi:S1-C subfamily serine protease
MRRSFHVAGALVLSAGVLSAQGSTRSRSRSDDAPVRAYSFDSGRFDDRDRAAIGITTSSGGMRDTLGLLVSSVTAGGPADKAGIEEGNRLISINGVNLRLSAADAGEGDMGDVTNRRLIRELEKVKAGDDVELRVWAGGQTKTVKVKTVAMEDLPSRTRNVRRELDDRPALGLSLSATGSRRDTLGMLVVRVATDGPAEKAGLVEGDRVSAINGVSLRVAPEDAGDGYMSSARMNRYRRELAKVSVGEDVELRIVSNGQTKTIRVKPVRAADLPRQRGGVMIIGDGAVGIGDIFPALPSITIPPMAPMAPGTPRVFEFDGNLNDGIRMRLDPRARIEIERQAQDAVRRARDAARDALERIENFRFDYDRRADELDAPEPAVAPTPSTPAPAVAPARPRASTRIASTESPAGSAYGYSTTNGGPFAVAYTPTAVPVASAGGMTYAEPAIATEGNVGVWIGDGAAFTLQDLRLARVNDDLAENLGRGSERGFLILEAGRRWSGLRAGDVLLEVDGRPVRDGDTARISLGAGTSHTAAVIRDGRQRVVSVDVR